MLFNSYTFAVFLVVALGLYKVFERSYRAQNFMLLFMSYLFYGWWDYRFLFLIVVSTSIDFMASHMIATGRMSKSSRWWTSFFPVVSALFFVTVQWDAIAYSRESFSISLAVDWAGLFPGDLNGWAIFLITTGATLLANLLYSPASRLSEARRRKAFVLLSVVANLAILGFFKYFNFFTENFIALSEQVFGYAPSTWSLNIILPVGISFYTFQTMSYTIDVYRKHVEPSASLMDFATYVAFFPQLVAGPIERGKHLMPQFERPRTVTAEDWREGWWLIGWGLYKKVVVADNMALLVNKTFGPYDSLSLTDVPDDGLRILFAVYAFAFQIYADFSGYTDIARGTARLMGFDIMLNFNLPYISRSPSEFWQRWHISLSSWLRDYLYISLGGNRGGTKRTYFNLVTTMVLGGLWHGAAWNFIVWGAYQGALLVGYRVAGVRTEGEGVPFWKAVLQGVIMFQLVCIGWLIFRAQNLTTIGLFLQSIFLHPVASPEAWTLLGDVLYYGWFLILFQTIQAWTGELSPMRRWHWFVQLNVWLFLLLSLITLKPSFKVEFIYFAF